MHQMCEPGLFDCVAVLGSLSTDVGVECELCDCFAVVVVASTVCRRRWGESNGRLFVDYAMGVELQLGAELTPFEVCPFTIDGVAFAAAPHGDRGLAVPLSSALPDDGDPLLLGQREGVRVRLGTDVVDHSVSQRNSSRASASSS